MLIDLAIHAPARRWQVDLATALRERGHHVRFVVGGQRKRLGVAGISVAVDQRVFGPKRSLFDLVDVARDAVDGNAADLIVALDDGAASAAALVPLFAGRPGDHGLIGMIVGGGAPVVRIERQGPEGPITLVSAVLAIEQRHMLSRSLDLVLARVMTLIVQAVERSQRSAPCLMSDCALPEAPPRGTALIHVMKGFRRKIGARLSGTGNRPEHWRIGYRRFVETSSGMAATPLALLAADDTRFYADPMPFVRDGRTHLFFEDYPYATGKGVIGHVEIDADGRASAPRTVLEQLCHLSYPFVIAHQGAIYMLPESSGAGRLQLFRADPFPDRWVADRILIDRIVAADATPILHQGRWWLFATVSDDGGSSWDQLCLFHAPDLLGPWTPHVDNPVLVDAGAARSAGAMWHDGETLMRVAQDCSGAYGDALVVCKVDRLDLSGYAQTIVRRIEAPSGTGADGIHTLNRAGDLEVVDLRFPPVARPGRWAAPRAPVRG